MEKMSKQKWLGHFTWTGKKMEIQILDENMTGLRTREKTC
jgi:hypothetical protein